jgi:hypothetical protein
MEGLVFLSDTIHEIHHRKMSGVIFKIDIKKSMIMSIGISYIK